jgi:imidazolonepropionase-like amidohydrolase
MSVLFLPGCQEEMAPTPQPTATTIALSSSPATNPTTVSPPAGLLAFSSTATGNGEIYLIQADSSAQVNLTANPADDYGPIWSPDGTQIAFWSNRDGEGPIYVMQADGSGVTAVPNTGPLDRPSGWSPDGQYLLLDSQQDVNSELYVIRPDGSGRTNLTRHPADDYTPAWSPDGRTIVFASNRDAPAGSFVTQLYQMTVAGGEVVRLSDFPAGAFGPVWSPDGETLAVTVVREAQNGADAYLMPIDGGDPQELFKAPLAGGWIYPQSWSPDGGYVVIASAGAGQVSLVTREGEIRGTLPIDATVVAWQPAGELIAPISLRPPAATAETRPLAPLLALTNGTLIDGTGVEPVDGAVLLTEGGRIKAVGTAATITIPPTAEVIDVQGATILPGFFNAHVHQSTNAQTLAAWAQAGVTTVCDLASVTGVVQDWDQWIIQAQRPTPSFFHFRDAVREHPQYARLVVAGPIVTVPGGYPIPVWGAEIALTVGSPEDARQKVAALLAAGADIIKISLEQGSKLSREEVAAIVTVAHEHGTQVITHVGSASHLVVGVAGGIDAVAHMAYTSISDELIARMVAGDIIVVPTLAVQETYDVERTAGENLRRFVAAGGKVALGDDYGNPGIQLGMPIHEMELMQAAGMTPMQIIVAATQHGARVCNVEEELGTLEAGKTADVLVVAGDPLQDIHALENVQLVVRDGVVIYREDSSP